MFLLYANHKTAALNCSLFVNRSCSDVREKRSYLVEVSRKCWFFFLGKVIAMYIIRKGGDFVFVSFTCNKNHDVAVVSSGGWRGDLPRQCLLSGW